jgi:translation elongation factor EF-G
VKKCDPKGRLLFGITKLVPQPSAAGRFFCLGRVYSGTASADKCVLMEEGFVPKRIEEARAKEAEAEPVAVAEGEAAADEDEADGSESPGAKSPAPQEMKEKKAKSQESKIQGVVTGTAKVFNSMLGVPAGNICLIGGIDQKLTKRGTVASSETDFAMRKPTIDQSPVIRVALTPKNAAELPKMVEALRRLVKSCPLSRPL